MDYDPGRRRFLGVSGSCAIGVLLGFHLTATAEGRRDPEPFDAWIRILPGGRVVLLVAKAEMGQGVLTALPMLLAEELDVEWANVEVVQAAVDPSKYDHLTVGSTSIQSLWMPLRRAGAAARQQLVRAAARRWKVSPGACHSDRGAVIGPRNQRLTYDALVAEASLLRPLLPAEVTLKPASQFRIIGRSQRRVDARGKVDGTAAFGMDVRVPGMLRAVIARCPAFGGRLLSCKSAAALAIPGVEAVFAIEPQGPDAFTRGGVAVVARNSWAAMEGRRRLEIAWSPPPQTQMDSTNAVQAALLANVGRAGPVVADRGDALVRLDCATKSVRATFELPFLAHVTLEPMNATVHVRPDAVEAWLPTQNAADARAAIARVLQRPASSVTVHQTMIGGGFGRRDATDFAVEAAQVAAVAAAPVQVIWSREDDIQFDRYRPMAVHALQASLDERGFPVAWLDRMSSVSIAAFLDPPATAKPASTEVGGALALAYAIPSFRMEYTPVRCAVPVGWWRSVEDSLNAFAVECFIDDLAAASAHDPIRYRAELLSGSQGSPQRDGVPIEAERLKRVLLAVADQAHWNSTAAPGRGRGVACHSCRGSYIAVVAEVSVSSTGVVVHRIWAAVDCGVVVNPDGAEAQIEGGLLFGTSAALYEAITVTDGRTEQGNFNDYPVLRMDASPKTQVRILPSEAAPTGVGEVAVPAVAPAIANAIFAVTGQRPRRLPINRSR